MFRIGEFAHIGGVTAKALRHYDRIGLFRPAWADPSTGYRFYSPAQLPELRRIVGLRDLGVPLAEVADLVRGGDDLRTVLRRRRGDLERHRAAIDHKLAALDIRVEMADEGPDVVVRSVEPERVASIRTMVRSGADIGVLFDEVEVAVRDAAARARRPPGQIEHGGFTDHTGDIEVWVPVTRAVAVGRVTTHRMEGGRMAAAMHHGGYEDLVRTREGLERWVVGAGMSAAGPTRIVYLQFGADPALKVPEHFLAKDDQDFLTEIQIPVG